MVLPDGTRLLGAHIAPGLRDDPGEHSPAHYDRREPEPPHDGHGILPTITPAELRARLADAEADVICVGHVHWAQDHRVGGQRAVVLGSVSNPLAPDLRANYWLLDASPHGHGLTHHAVDYDHAAVVEALHRVHHPCLDFLGAFQLGKMHAPADWRPFDRGVT